MIEVQTLLGDVFVGEEMEGLEDFERNQGLMLARSWKKPWNAQAKTDPEKAKVRFFPWTSIISIDYGSSDGSR